MFVFLEVAHQRFVFTKFICLQMFTSDEKSYEEEDETVVRSISVMIVEFSCQNGTIEEVKKIVTILNEAEVPSEDVVEVVISPPFVFLPIVKSLLRSDFLIAAQNCQVQNGGAFTGEVSADMLVNLGIPWFVGDKVAYALTKGLKVIACVGETLDQRESGSTMSVVAAQTKAIADKISHWSNVVIAYEPVWAIGTGKVATPAQAQEAHFELRNRLQENVGAEVAASTQII
ncbi:Triosephosphate isomerase, cytosolic [Camellia lanceoleosa]|uniref:Triosephosphate isomerase, cytosolic n=1 Tax=Camellia lanceoleosa TaxID=1840588 RepID=A0ACC0F566_9ERIC|nr:Triosephosphate isomerase, cytosolic [Camellia lanceoleosa]